MDSLRLKFLSIKKAFDTVDHQILCEKLKYYGIKGIANKWFSSYLSGRAQFVKINECTSEEQYTMASLKIPF